MDLRLIRTLGIGTKDRRQIPVLITTNSRAFAGWADMRLFDGPSRTLYHVAKMRNCRYWDTTGGVAELAINGPGPKAELDDISDALVVTDISVIRPLTPEAVRSWYRDQK